MKRLFYIWDYDIDETQFQALLDGEQTMGRLRCRLGGGTAVRIRPIPGNRAPVGFPSSRGRLAPMAYTYPFSGPTARFRFPGFLATPTLSGACVNDGSRFLS